MKTLKIVTLNIWNKSGPYPERLGLIREEVRRLSPDVFAAQEVLRFEPTDGATSANIVGDQTQELAEGLDLNVSYSGGSDLGGGLLLGNALFTPHPIVRSEVVVLPGTETGETRSLLYTLVETPLGLLPTFVTHLNWKLHHGSVRLRQVLVVAEQVLMRSGHEGWLPAVLMGDFNAAPDTDEIRYLTGKHVVNGKSVFFNDAWHYAGNGEGYTFDRRNPFCARSLEPPRRIDYVFVQEPDAWLRGEPVSARLAFDKAENGIFPSDHFGLCVELRGDKRGSS